MRKEQEYKQKQNVRGFKFWPNNVPFKYYVWVLRLKFQIVGILNNL